VSAMTDEERIDPANAVRWYASCASYSTIVVATCEEDARCLGAARIGQVARGKVRAGAVHVKRADEAMAAQWLAARRQVVAMEATLTAARKARA
jgi:hypothetical protein